MSENNLPLVCCEQPVAEFDFWLITSRHTTNDGRFLVAWPPFAKFSGSIDLIDLYKGKKT